MQEIVVNSDQRMLDGPEIVAAVARNNVQNESELPAVMLAAAQSLSAKNVDLVQIGNSVFFGFKSKPPNEDKLYGGVFNVDTARNFLKNGLKYMTYMQNKDITMYVADFEDERYVNAFRYWDRLIRKTNSDTAIDVMTKEGGGYRVFVKLGEDPMPSIG
jgi:hypothetical protein